MTTAVEQAIAALEPLAKISKSISESHGEDRDVSIIVTVGELRAAVSAQDALRAEQELAHKEIDRLVARLAKDEATATIEERSE
jgi:hypothetical protein